MESLEGVQTCTICGKVSQDKNPTFPLKCGHRLHIHDCPFELLQKDNVAPSCCTQDVTSVGDLLNDVMAYITRSFPDVIAKPNFSRHGKEFMDELADYVFRYHDPNP